MLSGFMLPTRCGWVFDHSRAPDRQFGSHTPGRRQLTNRRRCVSLGAICNPTKVSAVQMRKVIRTAAGEAQAFPLQMVVDRDEVLSGLVELLSHRQAR